MRAYGIGGFDEGVVDGYDLDGAVLYAVNVQFSSVWSHLHRICMLNLGDSRIPEDLDCVSTCSMERKGSDAHNSSNATKAIDTNL